MARRVSLEIVGDSSSLEKAFANAANSARKFNQQVGQSTRQFGTSQLKQQADAVKGITRAEEDLIRVRSRRASSLGPFRLAGVGLGAGVGLFAATQAVRELSASLETTGEAAFTTEGRIKNMVGALTSGNLVGAIKALTRVPETLEEAGLTAVYSTKQLDKLQQVVDGTAGNYRDLQVAKHMSNEEIKRGIAIENEAGTANAKLAQEAINVRNAEVAAANAHLTAEAAVTALNSSVERLGKTFVTQTGAVTTFKGAVDDLARPRGPGGVGWRAPRQPGLPSIGPLSPSQRRELDLIGAQGMERIPLLQDRLRQLRNQEKARNFDAKERLQILTNIRETEAQIAAIQADQAAKQKQAREAAAAEARRRREEARAAEVARELRILEGPIPTRGNLRRQFEQIQARAAKDRDFPRKMTEQFARVARLLKEEITPETREAINSWFETVRGEFDKGAAADPLAGLKQLSTRQLVAQFGAGLGLGGADRRRLGFNISGAGVQPLYASIQVDGREIGRAATTAQTRSGKRTAAQTSGRRG